MKLIDYLDPEEVRTSLEQNEWGTVIQDGQLMYWVCPQCAALVPTGDDSKGRTAKQHHTEWHVFIANNLRCTHGGPAA